MERLLSLKSREEILQSLTSITYVESTEEGPLSVIPRCPAELFEHLELDSGLGRFAHYASIIGKLTAFEKIARKKDGRVALALIDGARVVGYGVGCYPGSDDRWRKLGELMYEMAALEVSRNYRGMGIAGKIFRLLMQDDFFEDKIAYICGFSWHWDLDGSGLTMAQYRRMMLGLLKRYGFEECYTNEPNVALREENFFMVRIGSRVSQEDRIRFRDLRFGIVRRRPGTPAT
jgi:acetoin utilization protein AcuA